MLSINWSMCLYQKRSHETQIGRQKGQRLLCILQTSLQLILVLLIQTLYRQSTDKTGDLRMTSYTTKLQSVQQRYTNYLRQNNYY